MQNRVPPSIFYSMACCVPLLGAFGCSDSSSPDSACKNGSDIEIAADRTTIIDRATSQGKTYYLVLRVSGWHDKTEIVEVYDALPSFDRCGRNKEEPIAGDSLETAQTATRLHLDAEKKSLEIEYKDGEPDAHHNERLKLEFR